MSGDASNARGAENGETSPTPTVRRLYGIAAGGPDEEDYRRDLLEKYGAGIDPADPDLRS